MAEKFRSLVKVLRNEINRHQLFDNAVIKINSATEKLTNIPSAIATKYSVLVKQVSNDISVIQTNSSQLESKSLPKKVVKWWQWFQKLTGLDVVEMSRQQMILAQDKLFKTQDERRLLNREAALISEKLKEVYSELIQTRRDDPKYIQLTIVENKSLQDQSRIMSKLNLLDREEKDQFTQLTTAIKEYHDSQAMNAQKYKYLSILASAVVTIISLIGSMIFSDRRISNIRNTLFETQEKNESLIKNSIHSLETDMNAKLSEILTKLESNDKQSNQETIDVLSENMEQTIELSYSQIGFCIFGLYIMIKVLGI